MPAENATDATIRQVLRLVAALEEGNGAGGSPLFVFDAGYDPIAIGDGLSGVNAQALVDQFQTSVPLRSGPTNGWPRSTTASRGAVLSFES